MPPAIVDGRRRGAFLFRPIHGLQEECPEIEIGEIFGPGIELRENKL